MLSVFAMHCLQCLYHRRDSQYSVSMIDKDNKWYSTELYQMKIRFCKDLVFYFTNHVQSQILW